MTQPPDPPEHAPTITAPGAAAGPSASPRLGRGDVIGRYTVVETLGEGGMGVVYGAYDPDLDRKVALKLLRHDAGGAANTAARARLLREARALAKLSHPNVIRVYEVGTVGETDFIAMEFVDGRTLAVWLDEAPGWREVVRVFSQAGRGLAAAHRAGLVHRDFKPTNVLLDADGRVLVTDFGLAQVRGVAERGGDGARAGDRARADLTVTGALMGTPAYMAPEQLRGEVATERADQWSFCVSLYQGLYGARPFRGDDLESLRASVDGGRVADEPRGAKVPSWLRRAVVRGLAIDPAARYPSMDALLAELRRDPARLRRQLAAGSALALTAAAVVYGLSGSAAPGAACPDGEASFAGAWDGEVRGAIAERFRAGGRAAEPFATVLDRYKSDWKQHFVASCQDKRAGRRSEEEHVLVTGCLFERRDRLRSLVTILERDDADALEHAVAAAESLPALEACADVAELRRGLLPPEAAEVRQRVDQLRAELRELDALEDAVQHGLALAPALRAVDAARAVDYVPVRAEALYRLARVYFFLERPAEARAAFDEALLLAEQTGHDEVRAQALAGQFLVEVHFNTDDRVARKLERHARAAVERWGGDDELIARLENGLGQLDLENGDTAGALQRFEKALAIRENMGAGTLHIVEQRQRIASVHMLRGDLETARSIFSDSLELLRGRLGDDHPRVAHARETLGSVLRAERRFDEAREQYQRARAFWDSPSGKATLEPYRHSSLARGTRVLSGVVIGPDGTPVAGAEVVAGEIVVGDGRYLFATSGGADEARAGVVRAVTDDRGRFTLDAARSARLVLGAELSSIGRVVLPVDGEEAHDDLVLRLAPWGTVRGTLRAGTARMFDVGVSASPSILAGTGHIVASAVDEEGRYELRVPAGPHLLFAGVGSSTRSTRFVTRTLEVRAGQTHEVDFEITDTGVTVDLVVSAERGAPLDSAQLFVFDEPVSMKSVSDLEARFAAAAARGTPRTGFVQRRRLASGEPEYYMQLDYVSPGRKGVCVIPLAGELKDPRYAQRLQGFVEHLEVHCRTVEVTREPPTQTVRLVVPPMKPLPPVSE